MRRACDDKQPAPDLDSGALPQPDREDGVSEHRTVMPVILLLRQYFHSDEPAWKENAPGLVMLRTQAAYSS